MQTLELTFPRPCPISSGTMKRRSSDTAPQKPPLPALAQRQHVAIRLKAIRVALKLKPVDVCKALGFQRNAYSQWESGDSRPNLDDMIRFSERYGVPLDWIYRGDPSRLPQDIADEVLRLERSYSSASPADTGRTSKRAANAS